MDLTLSEDCQLNRAAGPVIVGVSGGPDSLYLLHTLVRLGYTTIAAHLDHALRPESAGDAEFVRQTARRFETQAVFARIDVAAAAKAEHRSIEEAARFARYGFLFRVAKEHDAAAVAVGHTADDQAETVLMHLLRGAGLSGLRNMGYRSLPNPWSASIPLVRPLLGFWRAEINSYLEKHALQALTDASNTDFRFYRNRLRHEALPYLETLNPGIRRRLWQTAALLRDDSEVIAAVVDEAWNVLCVEERSNAIALHVERLRRQPRSVQRHVLRFAIARLRPGLRDVDFAAVQRALDFLQRPSASGQADWIAGLRLETDVERLWLADHAAELPTAARLKLPPEVVWTLDVPGEIALPDGRRLHGETHALTSELFAQATANADPFNAWLDLDRLELPLTVRSRRRGERFRPLGMGGHSLKLSDFMINVGIPRRARTGWPLVISGKEVAWVPGYQIGEAFALSDQSTRVLSLRITQ